MEAPSHLLSLKVMRLSRPSLATSSQPFFTHSPSFSAHSTASVLSLQGKSPLPGYPKTLRDFSLSPLLTLPEAFGAIHLGETFSSIICVNNDAPEAAAEHVSMRIEMQTATTKVLLKEVGGQGNTLLGSQMLDAVVHHEIKELGQHVLACAISYHIPPSMRGSFASPEDPSNPTLRSFRKYYKFVVTNPLSVKTKVHTPKSPSALMSKSEREKIFLEIHVQNMTQGPMWFDRMSFERFEGWEVEDKNVLPVSGSVNNDPKLEQRSVFSGPTAVLQPQDMRQYLYVLTPTPPSVPSFPVPPAPGSVINLGRLDIWWRTAFGEPGRLTTSMLTRRIPLPPQPASAIPSHLQQRVNAGVPPRPHSPQIQPPSRPGSPFKPRVTQASSPLPQSPGLSSQPLPPQVARQDLEVDLVVRHVPRDEIQLDTPFTMKFALTVSGTLSLRFKHRVVFLVVQHLRPNPSPPPPSLVAISEPFMPNLPAAMLSASSLSMSPRAGSLSLGDRFTAHSPEPGSRFIIDGHPKDGSLPPPFFATSSGDGNHAIPHEGNVVSLGSSTINLGPLRITRPPPSPHGPMPLRGEATTEFELDYIPLKAGFSTIGGLRVIQVGDAEVDDGDAVDRADEKEMRVLKEWDVIGEVWIQAASSLALES